MGKVKLEGEDKQTYKFASHFCQMYVKKEIKMVPFLFGYIEEYRTVEFIKDGEQTQVAVKNLYSFT